MLFLLAGCGEDEPAEPNNGTDDPTYGTLVLESDDAASGIIGTFTLADREVQFTSHLDAATGVAQAVYLVDGVAIVESEVVSNEEGAIRVGGVEVDGTGALSPVEEDALATLAADNSSLLVALVPLELGCVVEDEETAQQRAALLLPWQILIKYEPSFDDVIERSAESSCQYFPDLSPTQPESITAHGGLQLAPEDPIPNIYGFFPLDAEGAVSMKDHIGGPCDAGCRGVCGPDCPSPPCTIEETTVCEVVDGQNTGDGQTVIAFTECGSAQGCREHDQCYDDCNGVGCGSWTAAACRRGCDNLAKERWGYSNVLFWVRGLGTFDQNLNFSHVGESLVMLDECPLSSDPGPDPVVEAVFPCPATFPTREEGIWELSDNWLQFSDAPAHNYICRYVPPLGVEVHPWIGDYWTFSIFWRTERSDGYPGCGVLPPNPGQEVASDSHNTYIATHQMTNEPEMFQADVWTFASLLLTTSETGVDAITSQVVTPASAASCE